ncbi:MAG: hypothetical protein [Circular genetic element sp.]|nr:MAG: hypothetical protein [Circular genetic element sp.]
MRGCVDLLWCGALMRLRALLWSCSLGHHEGMMLSLLCLVDIGCRLVRVAWLGRLCSLLVVTLWVPTRVGSGLVTVGAHWVLDCLTFSVSNIND